MGLFKAVDNSDTPIMNFAIEYLCSNEKDRKRVLACWYVAPAEFFEQKIGENNLVTLSL